MPLAVNKWIENSGITFLLGLMWKTKKAKKEKEKATASDKQSPIVWERISFKAGLGYLKSEIQYMIPFFLLAYLMAHPVLV